MFNPVNVDNRLRFRIRGRVIVFTNSLHTEFITEDLTRSFPLFSVGYFQDKQGMSFMVELQGFLSFDLGSEVRIIELSDFVTGFYDPSAWAFLTVADPFEAFIGGISLEDPEGGPRTVVLDVKTSVQTFTQFRSTVPFSLEQVATVFDDFQGPWKGPKGYPPHIFKQVIT